MDWRFSEDNFLEDFHSGYQIVLVSGTWRNPTEISPIIPKNMRPVEQVRMLRLGLAYAKENAYLRNRIAVLS